MASPVERRRGVWLAVVAVAVAVLLGWWLWPKGSRSGPAAAERDGGPERTPVGAEVESVEAEVASIAGAVLSRDELGKAIAGARVCAWRLGNEERVSDPLATRCIPTGANGRYRFTELAPGHYRIGASAAGKLPAVWEDPSEEGRPVLRLGVGEARTDVDFALANGGFELAGTVVDVTGGAIDGALVVASGPGIFFRGPVATATSDEHGRFSIWVAAGEYGLRAAADGYAPAMLRAQTPNQQIELRLTPESVLIGRVVDAQSGAGLAGIEVAPDRHDHDRIQTTVSDEDGSFRLGGLAPGIYQPEAIGESVYGRAALPVHVGLGQTSAPIELRVYPAHRLRGQIVAVDHRLPEPERARGCATGWASLSGGGVRRHVQADDRGWVSFEGVPPGRHDLQVVCPEGAESSMSLEQRLELRGDLDDQRWELDVAAITIAGRAVDDHGRGVAGVYIDSTGPGGDAHDLTMAGGEFELHVREPGRHRITAKLRGQREPIVTLELEVGDDGVDGVELAIGEVAAVRGRVQDPDGNPVPGIQVALCDSEGDPRHWATTDGDGRFGFDAQAPGRWWIALRDELDEHGHDPVGEPVELSADRIAEVVRTIEARHGSIRGTVTAEGGPVDDAWVVAGRGSIDALVDGWEIGPILCDVDGSFVLDDLGEGSWAIRAYRKEGGGEASVGGVELGATVELELAATASVAGRVRHRDGSAPEQFEIDAVSGDRRREHSYYRSDGAFELAKLPAGSWTLTVVADSGSAEQQVELAAGQQITDLQIELDPRVTIRGRLVDSRTGAAVTSVEIGHQSSGGFDRRSKPDADGNFELEGVPPGRVELWVTPRDFRSATYSMQGVVLDLADEPLVQDVGELPLAGGKLEPGQSPGELGFEYRIAGFDQNLERVDEWHIEVTKLTRGGPAELAGLRVGDVITSIDGASVEGRRAGHTGIYLRKLAAGDEIAIERRDAATITVVAAPLSTK